MSKTPEELAEEFSKVNAETDVGALGCYRQGLYEGFLAGYQAAKESNSPEKPDDCNSSNNSDGWISVKDRLPERGENYLVLFRVRGDKHSPAQFEITWFDNTWDFPSTFEVTHWMPMPKPPEEV
jgi:hypothetical protein